MGDTNTVIVPASSPQPPTPRPRRRLLTVLGVLLVVTGLSFLGVYVYQAYLDPVIDVAAAKQQVGQVKKEWAQGTKPSSKIPGNAVALMRIPDFGPDFEVAVMTGTTEYSLSVGVGWFDHTAAPGRVGNFAVAGHRGASGPLVPLLDLKPGSRVIVETRDNVFVYALTNYPKDLTVDKYQTWVIDPVPGQPDAEPTKKLITLVTCRNFFHSAERSVAFGELVETIKK
ncbi:MAG TPA: class E sortase [Micropruina sp.]|nr:class E sortase [Micropruina sp.]